MISDGAPHVLVLEIEDFGEGKVLAPESLPK
jgi:hypothetical protein